MCTVRSLHHSLEPSIADSSPKQCLSLQFPKRHIIPIYIPAHTRICWIRSRVKYRTTSQFVQNLTILRLIAKWVFSLCALLKTIFTSVIISQKHRNLYVMLPIRKKATLLLTAVCGFFPSTLQKITFTQSKMSKKHRTVNSQFSN